jgi:hypothetical protein
MFNGEFGNDGSTTKGSPTLFGLFRTPSSDYTSARLTLNDEQNLLRVTASKSGSIAKEISEPVTCINGTIVHHDNGEGCSDGTCSKWNYTTTLSAASDRALIVYSIKVVHSSDLFFRWTNEFDYLYLFRRVTEK